MNDPSEPSRVSRHDSVMYPVPRVSFPQVSQSLGALGPWSTEAARTAARRDWRRMGCSAESVAYSRIVASYRRRMGVVAVREMARHRIRQSAYVGLTRQQLDDIMQERERQRDRLEAAAAAADRSVEIAQSYVVPAFERGA